MARFTLYSGKCSFEETKILLFRLYNIIFLQQGSNGVIGIHPLSRSALLHENVKMENSHFPQAEAAPSWFAGLLAKSSAFRVP